MRSEKRGNTLESIEFNKKNYLKFLLLAIFIPFILNILATAFWDLFLKTAFPAWKNQVFDFFQTAMEYISRIDYSEIAKGSHERISLKIYFTILLFFAGITIFSMIIGYDKLKSNEKTISDLQKNYEMLVSVSKTPLEINNDIPKDARKEFEVAEKITQNAIRSHFLWCFIMTLCLFNLFFSLIKDIYIDSAVAHFNQCCGIVEPIISPKELAQIKSDFAQISNKDGFKEVLSRMESKMGDKKLKIPQFKIW